MVNVPALCVVLDRWSDLRIGQIKDLKISSAVSPESIHHQGVREKTQLSESG
jgi:hypothetical protein